MLSIANEVSNNIDDIYASEAPNIASMVGKIFGKRMKDTVSKNIKQPTHKPEKKYPRSYNPFNPNMAPELHRILRKELDQLLRSKGIIEWLRENLVDEEDPDNDEVFTMDDYDMFISEPFYWSTQYIYLVPYMGNTAEELTYRVGDRVGDLLVNTLNDNKAFLQKYPEIASIGHKNFHIVVVPRMYDDYDYRQ